METLGAGEPGRQDPPRRDRRFFRALLFALLVVSVACAAGIARVLVVVAYPLG